MIGIIYCDENERPNTLKALDIKKIGSFIFEKHKINNQYFILVNSNIGIVNAASCTTLLIEKYSINKIYNFGAVGASDKLKKMNIVIPRYIYFYDVITPWYKRGQIPNSKEKYKNCIKNNNYKDFNLGTGMAFLTNKSDIKNIQKDLPVDVFDMEAAAISHICYNKEIKFGCVKCVSDIIGHESQNINDINKLISKAGQIAFDKLIELIM